MSRKRKITLGVLAVILVFFLWYTRPRSFEELVGDGRVKSISMSASIFVFEEGLPHFDTWANFQKQNSEESITLLESVWGTIGYKCGKYECQQF